MKTGRTDPQFPLPIRPCSPSGVSPPCSHHPHCTLPCPSWLPPPAGAWEPSSPSRPSPMSRRSHCFRCSSPPAACFVGGVPDRPDTADQMVPAAAAPGGPGCAESWPGLRPQLDLADHDVILLRCGARALGTKHTRRPAIQFGAQNAPASLRTCFAGGRRTWSYVGFASTGLFARYRRSRSKLSVTGDWLLRAVGRPGRVVPAVWVWERRRGGGRPGQCRLRTPRRIRRRWRCRPAGGSARTCRRPPARRPER